MKLKFAQIDADGVVTTVLVGPSADWLGKRLGEVWVETSDATYGGVHYTDGEPSADQSKALRYNYAGIGFTYDTDRDAFIPPKPYQSWELDEAACLWLAPIPYPGDGGMSTWDESEGNWVEVVNATK